MKLKVFICPRCGTGVFSRTQQDYRVCECYAIGVSGEPATPRLNVGSALASKVKMTEVDVRASVNALEDDWATMTDAFGVFPKGDAKLKNARPIKPNEIVQYIQTAQKVEGAEGDEDEGDEDVEAPGAGAGEAGEEEATVDE